MKIRSKKRAFTIVELVIVVAVIGILAAILIPTFVGLTGKANKTADSSLVKNLNTALAMAEQDSAVYKGVIISNQNDTMHDAIIDLEYEGYHLENLTTRSNEKLLWNSKTNRFVLEDDRSVKESETPEQFWKIVKSTSEMGNYSGYAHSDYSSSEANVSAGFDVGDLKTIKTINYTNTTTKNKNVVIRTNGGKLTVNAPIDSVKHYGFVDSVLVEKIKNASYHEFAKTYQIAVSKGRIVLEKTSKVMSIHLNANEAGNGYEDITIATAEGVELPAFISRDPVIVSQDIIMVTLEQLDSKGNIKTSETEEVWITTDNIADEEYSENADVDSELGQKFLETTGNTNVADKEETEQQAKLHSIQVDETTYELIDKEDLLLFASLVNKGADFAGCTVNLKADIDLENMDWEPIGYLTENDHDTSYNYSKNHTDGTGGIELTDSKAFSGLFNGNGHTIMNLKPVQPDDTKYGVGLFGLLHSSTHNASLFGTQTTKEMLFANSNIQYNKLSESNYSCVVKNLNLENVTIGSNSESYFFAGSVAGIAFASNINACDVKNVEIHGSRIVGGIVGSAGASVIQNCTNGTSTVHGLIKSIQNAGGMVGSLENYYFVKGYSHTVISNCTNYCDIEVTNTNAGGIVGLAQGRGDCGVVDCTNYGEIALAKATIDSTSLRSIGGIVANGASTSLFYHCTNNGNIVSRATLTNGETSLSAGVHLGGIACYMVSSYFYNCINNGTISGNANYLGGIISATHDTYQTLSLVNCGNNGTLSNTYVLGSSSTLCAGGNAVIGIEGQVDKLSFVKEYLNQLSNGVDLTQISVVDKEDGNLVVPEGVTTLKVNTNVCDSLTINASTVAKLTLNCPDIDVTVNGDISTTDLIVEEAKSVTISSSSAVSDLAIKNVATVINNGTVESIGFFATEMTSPIYCENNGTVARNDSYAISFYADTVNKQGSNLVVNFMNNGTITANGAYPIGVTTGANNVLNFHASATSVIGSNSHLAIAFNANGALNYSYDSHATRTCGSYIHENSNGSYMLINDEDFHF